LFISNNNNNNIKNKKNGYEDDNVTADENGSITPKLAGNAKNSGNNMEQVVSHSFSNGNNSINNNNINMIWPTGLTSSGLRLTN